MLQTTIEVKHRLRFVANTSPGFNGNLNNTEFLNLLVMGLNSTTLGRLCDGVKIRAIEVWAANSAGNASNTVELEWLNPDSAVNSYSGPGTTSSDTALGITDIAHIRCIPPKGSAASFWLNDMVATTNIIRLVVPQGGVVDVDLDLVLMDNDDPITIGLLSGVTPGKLYCRALDSLAGTPKLLPISYDSK